MEHGLWHSQQTTDHGSKLAEDCFSIFKLLGGKKGNFCDTWKFYDIQMSVSINKVLLEHGHIHSFI